MELMESRRRLLMQEHSVNNSPVILEYDKRYKPGGNIDYFSDRCITKIYDCYCDNNHRQFYAYGIESTTINYKSGAYYDYWNTPCLTPQNVILAKYATEQLAFTLVTSTIDDCFVIQNGTGIILFAGKNSIYYGHRNISELE